MVRSKPITKQIKVGKHKFKIEIYPSLVDWEIFPYDYEAALYAFSNKQRLENIVEKKYLYENTKV